MKKGRVSALIGLFTVVCLVVGVLVWPTPKEAKAEHLRLDIWAQIDWMDQLDPWWVDVTVTLLDANNVPINGQVLHLATQGNMVWTGTMWFIPDEAVRYRIDWITGNDLWQPTPAVFGNIDWPNEEIFRDPLTTARPGI